MARLGIDIGTTSVKCSYIRSRSMSSLVSHSKQVHGATITSDGKHEQSASLILKALYLAIEDLSTDTDEGFLDVETVSLCCQMHGIVFWNSIDDASNLITWQDQRCDEQFIAELGSKCTMQPDIHTGYGCATLSWLEKYDRDILKRYKHCGTIADLIVYDMCGLSKSVISDHNAQSWGFFDEKTHSWSDETLVKANITFKLPKVMRFGSKVGNIVNDKYRIKLGARVNIPIGDLQGSVYSVLGNKSGRVFNYGTASQLVYSIRDEDDNQVLPHSVRRTLYTEDFNLLTAASLNGGNAVNLIYDQLFHDKGIDYDDLMNEAYSKRNTTLTVDPVFLGERHDTRKFGSFSNIQLNNFTIGDIAAATFRGIISNLISMMEHFRGDQSAPLYAVGIADREIMQYYLREVIGEFILHEQEVTAAYGAILFDIDNEIP